MKKFRLEIATFTVQGALTAAAAGAHRIELCEGPAEGGTTPSYGTLKLIKEKIAIPVFPIIRPRGGDFLYTDEEFSIMCRDIELCKQLGYEGVVIGLLHADGSIDKERTRLLTELAYPMEVTFHRAFDRCRNPLESLEDVIACGCQRILTSGQVPNAFDNKELLAQLVKKADERIIIMPGSGVRSSNVFELAQATGAVEFHSSARVSIATQMNFVVEGMNETLTHAGVDAGEVKNTLAALERYFG